MIGPPVCPNIAERVHEQCAASGIKIYHEIGRTQIHKDHSACTKATCFANDLRDSEIPPQHTSTECSCPLRRADPHQLQQILEWHGIALIRLDEIDEKIEIRVEPKVNDMEYFAISHALADGLCNSERNELPECQLRRILRSVKSAMLRQRLPQDVPVYIWIDTMCLPLRSSPCNGAAISTFQALQHVMGNALAVVVLDTDIAVLSQNSSYAERFLKISFSSWGSRLWTLFEAITARKLLFECSSGVMDLEDFHESSLDVPIIGVASDWPPLLYTRLGKFRERHLRDRDVLEQALKWARTSVESDSVLLKSAMRCLFEAPTFDLVAFIYFFKSQQLLEATEQGVIDATCMVQVRGTPCTAL